MFIHKHIHTPNTYAYTCTYTYIFTYISPAHLQMETQIIKANSDVILPISIVVVILKSAAE